MSNQSTSTAFALQDILSGIADSLNQAQQQLKNVPPFDPYGRPNTVYQLPYLDFTLQVTSEFESQTVTNTGGSALLKKNYLLFRPVRSTENNESLKNQIVSTVSGRFVAVVPNEGLPQVILEVEYSSPQLDNGYVTTIKVTLKNVAGEILNNTKVEFNYDEEISKQMSSGINPGNTQPEFTVSEIHTNHLGEAHTTLTLPKALYESGFTFVIKVNAGPIFSSIAISK